jgi:hypothetical protein
VPIEPAPGGLAAGAGGRPEIASGADAALSLAVAIELVSTTAAVLGITATVGAGDS